MGRICAQGPTGSHLQTPLPLLLEPSLLPSLRDPSNVRPEDSDPSAASHSAPRIASKCQMANQALAGAVPGSPPFLSTLQSTEKRRRTSTARFQAAVFAPASPVLSPSPGGTDLGHAGRTPDQGVPGKRGPALKLSPVPSSQAKL